MTLGEMETPVIHRQVRLHRRQLPQMQIRQTPSMAARVFTSEDVSNIRNMLLGVDQEPAYDAEFFLYATSYYAILRIACESNFPGRIRGYTKQQYVVSLLHQACVLPLCSLAWMAGVFEDTPALIYLLTGAYLASDSIINYTPAHGVITGMAGHSRHVVGGGRIGPDFSWGVHAHHIFTIVLCALGPNLPPWPVVEGAFCILLGEAGSMWISITLLWPNPLNYMIRFWAFLVTRVLAFTIALDIARQISYWPVLLAWLVLVTGLFFDNFRTLSRMAGTRNGGGSEHGKWPL